MTLQQQYDNAARAIAQEGRLSPDVSTAALFAYVDSVPGHRDALGTVLAAQMRAAQGGGRPIDPTPETRRIECEQRMLDALCLFDFQMLRAAQVPVAFPGKDAAAILKMTEDAQESIRSILAAIPALLAAHRALRPWHPSDGPQGDAV